MSDNKTDNNLKIKLKISTAANYHYLLTDSKKTL